ncbi:MAG: periplasmic heavy metal sensor [Aquabacterium sp.]|uniref:Spy/CpxP family protein refolding chaperone n=1 Tax=Aquabacterium sp. TaxID=1872578 RepID=UPI002727A4D9|nr:periplasmic heavy metal sensor [Aquabacterium sp.]MDO9002865.1 periplasmic heavy metal sensor [Aquabacterium sp.]
MKITFTATCLALLSSLAVAAGADIKALSVDDVQGYLSGKGMGQAKAAELNGYPGPSHVLSLSKELELTPGQKAQTQALFNDMASRSKRVGQQLVEEERSLNELFVAKTATPERLSIAMAKIGQLQGQVRQVHLEAHIHQHAILTPSQIAKYQVLRGHGEASANGPQHHRHP